MNLVFCINQSNSHLCIVDPFLIAAHIVTAYHVNWPIGACCIQAQIIGHDLLTLGIRKHLISAQAVAVANAHLLVILATHGVQAGFRFCIANLSGTI